MISIDDIVDSMLVVIGEGGVSSTNTLHPSVVTAKRIIKAEDIEFQSRGWWFNKELSLKLLPDNAGRVSLPENILSFTVTGIDNKPVTEKVRYVLRGSNVYDTYKHSNQINSTIIADIVVRVSVDDMPPQASNYLRAKCVEEMYLSDDGDQTKLEKLERKRMEAWQLLKATDLSAQAVNALDGPNAARLLTGYRGGYRMPGDPR